MSYFLANVSRDDIANAKSGEIPFYNKEANSEKKKEKTPTPPPAYSKPVDETSF